jgi:hypothetical protein
MDTCTGPYLVLTVLPSKLVAPVADGTDGTDAGPWVVAFGVAAGGATGFVERARGALGRGAAAVELAEEACAAKKALRPPAVTRLSASAALRLPLAA